MLGICGVQAAAQSSQDKTSAIHLSAKHSLQSPLTRLGLTLQSEQGRVYSQPQMPAQNSSFRGTREDEWCSRGGRALACGAGLLPITQRWVSDPL